MKTSFKRLILYGTGLRAEWFIDENKDICDILFCLDKNRLSGECYGIPIKTWDDVADSGAERIVIACKEKYTKEIFLRIQYKCDYYGLEIYDWRGLNLRESYRYEYSSVELKRFISSDSRADLITEIDKHDAISFDMFDTLVMRKVIEPVDVFDIVAARISDKKLASGYKKKRKEHELRVNGVINGYRAIYDSFAHEEQLPAWQADELYDLEIECEKEVLVVREAMLDLLQYAVSAGKRVNIISDMYFTHDILENLLENLGIRGYEKVFSSCDYGTVKRQDLFDVYTDEIVAGSYLHIGDNWEADGVSAEEHGIDSFIIPTAIEMLQYSDMRRILYYANGTFNRRMIGEAVAGLFNDPFVLCGRGSRIRLDSVITLGRCLVAPLIFMYLYRLVQVVSEGKYDKVLLGARDGYIFDRIIKETGCIENAEKYVYVLISRAVAFRVGMGYPEVDADYKRYLEIDSRRRLKGESATPFYHTKKGFDLYLSSLGISKEKNNLFCDLISGGTVQYCIKHLFNQGLDGYYMGRSFAYMDRKLNYITLYSREDIPHDQLLIERLETLVSAPVPSVDDVDNTGSFIYEREYRDEEELVLTERIQDEVVTGVSDLFILKELYGSEPDEMLVHALFETLDQMTMTGELSEMKKWIYIDNNGNKTKLFY